MARLFSRLLTTMASHGPWRGPAEVAPGGASDGDDLTVERGRVASDWAARCAQNQVTDATSPLPPSSLSRTWGQRRTWASKDVWGA
jgi:hypothetical protein